VQGDNGPVAIVKVLSANDTGETGAHQAGILVPKEPRILSFFPKVDCSIRNPRHHLVFHDSEGQRWEFAFIYYNNVFFGGTRNEYRLTRMTPYIKSVGLKCGDRIILRRDFESRRRLITYGRASRLEWNASGALKLGNTWKEIKL
jgi:hypothetical protein